MCASVVPGGDTPPVFQLCKQIFDHVPFLVERLTIFDGNFAVSLWWDAGRDVLLCQHGADFFAVIALVAKYGFGPWQAFKQYVCALKVAELPFSY